jgi:hypothetical protein
MLTVREPIPLKIHNVAIIIEMYKGFILRE